ncbi:MAG: peptide-methionine (S)-S-oxide reductase MsrA [Verrucomicrobiota bacterium]
MERLKKLPYTLSTAFVMICLSACSAMTATDSSPVEDTTPEGLASVVVGAGCFWCVEAFFEKQPGVVEAISGYAGGERPNPSYKEVSRGATKHAEVVKVIYDPTKTDLRTLIDFFWTTHDVSRGDGVWPDFGPQYRSILLYADSEELAIFEASKEAFSEAQGVKIATEISKLDIFYPAENYHQDFAQNNPKNRYIQNILNPKLKKLGI